MCLKSDHRVILKENSDLVQEVGRLLTENEELRTPAEVPLPTYKTWGITLL